MLAFLNQVRKPTLDLPLDVRRKMWFKPFMQSYLVVFIGYLTMYLIRKNFNIAQNDTDLHLWVEHDAAGDDWLGLLHHLRRGQDARVLLCRR